MAVELIVMSTVVTLWGLSGAIPAGGAQGAGNRKRTMMLFWILYLLVLAPAAAIAFDVLGIIPLQPFLFVGAWGGVLGTGLLACKWFERPTLFRGMTALAAFGLTALVLVLAPRAHG